MPYALAAQRAPTWNKIAVEELEQVLLAHGMTRGRLTVLYGRDPLAVARTVVVLLYAGVADVRLHNGLEGNLCLQWWMAGVERG